MSRVVLLLLLFLRSTTTDFLFAAGNWTHSTNLFSELHFVPGYNEAGRWDILTGGNWTATNHTDLRLLGDAAVYLCPCPLPPCAVEDGPPKPGFNTSIFTCMEPRTHNLSYVACTIFHGERTNVTCVTPEFAVACDVPAFEPDNALRKWWQNNATPSHSFYNEHVQSVSCIARGMREQEVGFVGGAADIHKTRGGGFKDRRKLYGAIMKEKCETVCQQVRATDRRRRRAARAILPCSQRAILSSSQVCQTVCVTEHQSVHQIFDEMNNWVRASAQFCGALRNALTPHTRALRCSTPRSTTTCASLCGTTRCTTSARPRSTWRASAPTSPASGARC